MTMLLGYRGSVNSWECDENDHLNVRFYVEKHWQTVCAVLPELGLPSQNTTSALAVQHLRFLQESRLAAPISGYAAVVDAHAGGGVLTELRNTFTDEVLSTCIHRFDLPVEGNGVDLPEHARPRGVPDADLPYVVLKLPDVDEYGFRIIGKGVVQQAECDGDGRMAVHNYMGRMSDSMPHLWGLLGAKGRELDPGEGGAVLEYRLCYHRPLAAGDGFAFHSGLAEVGTKVQRFAHLVFRDDGTLILSAQAAGVRMDLEARKALTLSAERLAHMEALKLKPFGG